tara:strand:- start:67 stop:219 length:153 start_codon:yes stop_codon:yes gene_type:complete
MKEPSAETDTCKKGAIPTASGIRFTIGIRKAQGLMYIEQETNLAEVIIGQ